MVCMPISNAMGTAEVYVDPQIVADPTKGAGTSFSIDICVVDVEDLYSYEAKLKWNGPVLNATSVTQGDFLKRSGPRTNDPTDNEAFLENQEQSPTDTDVGGQWSNATGAYTSGDDNFAYSTVGDNIQVYKSYSLNIPSDAVINTVEVGFCGLTLNTTGKRGNDTVNIMVSKDGGTSYSLFEYTVLLTEVNQTKWIPVTGAFPSWTYTDFSDANWRVKIKHVAVPNANVSDWDTIYCDWLPTRVSYSYPWQNPTGAYTLGDAQRASSSLTDYEHLYRNYGFSVDPGFTLSNIEVGFTGYTTGDDKVGLSVSRDGGATWGTEYVKTLGTSETTIWQSMKLAFPPLPPWSYSHFSDGAWRVKVRHVVIGSEDEVYCDWLPTRLTYYYKTTFMPRIWNEPDPTGESDYVYFYGSLKAPATKGVHGSGILATVTFLVEVDQPNSTDLELYSVGLLNSFGISITCTTQNGTFKNTFISDIDIDGEVEYDDFIVLAGAYGSHEGMPAYDERADFNCDGYVNYDDFIILAGEYGMHV